MRKYRKGMSIIELAVIIAVSVILIALAVPKVNKFIDDAKIAKRNNDFVLVYNSVMNGYINFLADGNTLINSGEFTKYGEMIVLDMSEDDISIIKPYIDKLLPEEYDISYEYKYTDSISISTSSKNIDYSSYINKLYDDKNYNTWGVFPILELDEQENVIVVDILIVNDGYYSRSSNKPIKHNNVDLTLSK